MENVTAKGTLEKAPFQSKQPATLPFYGQSSGMPRPYETRPHNPKYVQKWAARFVINDYSTKTPGCVTKMQDDPGWDTLQKRRRDSSRCMMYKIYHHLVDVPTE